MIVEYDICQANAEKEPRLCENYLHKEKKKIFYSKKLNRLKGQK